MPTITRHKTPSINPILMAAAFFGATYSTFPACTTAMGAGTKSRDLIMRLGWKQNCALFTPSSGSMDGREYSGTRGSMVSGDFESPMLPSTWERTREGMRSFSYTRSKQTRDGEQSSRGTRTTRLPWRLAGIPWSGTTRWTSTSGFAGTIVGALPTLEKAC